jgi:hypothetical protein
MNQHDIKLAIVRDFLSAYEEQEDADWSPEWRALAERCRAALSGDNYKPPIDPPRPKGHHPYG